MSSPDTSADTPGRTSPVSMPIERELEVPEGGRLLHPGDPAVGSSVVYTWAENAEAGAPLVLIFPGGGYGCLATGHEGDDVAAAFNRCGFHAGVVRYRLGPHHHHPAMIRDAVAAVRLSRAVRSERDDPGPIAACGFSAGGHLVASLATHAEAADARPAAVVLGYAVISMTASHTHLGSRENLLGPNPSPAERHGVSPEHHVGPESPPAFLWHPADDPVVPVANSIAYAEACVSAGVAVELHVYPDGGHGIGLAPDIPGVRDWFKAAVGFLRRTCGAVAD